MTADVDALAEDCYWKSYDAVWESSGYADPLAATSAAIKAAVTVGYGRGHKDGVAEERARIVAWLRNARGFYAVAADLESGKR